MKSITILCVFILIVGCVSISTDDYKKVSKITILKGRITDKSGNAIPDVKVTLYGGICTVFEASSTKTDTNGEYHCDLSVCSRMVTEDKKYAYYLVHMALSHPRFACVDGKSMRTIHVPAVKDHVLEKDFAMIPAGTLLGIVKSKEGLPFANLPLRFIGRNNSVFHRYITTDAEGYFEVCGLYPQSYRIDVNRPKLQYPVIGKANVDAERITNVSLVFAENKNKKIEQKK